MSCQKLVKNYNFDIIECEIKLDAFYYISNKLLYVD